MINLKKVDSTAIAAIGHDPETDELHVIYKSAKSVHVYADVDPGKYEALEKAESIGKALNELRQQGLRFRVAPLEDYEVPQ